MLSMVNKIKWSACDYAAQGMIDEMLTQLNLSYREIEHRLNGQMSYNRVRDLRLGRRAPVRLSEFMALCELCGVASDDAINELSSRTMKVERSVCDNMKNSGQKG